MKMSAVKNLTFFNLHVSFFLFYMQIFLPYVILVTSSTFQFVVIRRFITSKDVCWNIRNVKLKSLPLWPNPVPMQDFGESRLPSG